jgi:hypothetical protein
MNRKNKGMQITGMTMTNVPNPHRKPAPFRKLFAAGSEHYVVTIYGDEAKAYIKPQLFKLGVSEKKMSIMYPRPLYPTQY